MLTLNINVGENVKNGGLNLNQDDLARISESAAISIQTLVRKTFRSHSKSPWWMRAADATLVTPTDDPSAFSIRVNQPGVHLRWKGGVVRAGVNQSRFSGQPTKWLTIPKGVHESALEAKGSGLLFIRPGKKRCAFLVESTSKIAKRGKRKGQTILAPDLDNNKKLKVAFLLAKETNHKPNPKVFPTLQSLSEEGERSAEKSVRNILRNRNK